MQLLLQITHISEYYTNISFRLVKCLNFKKTQKSWSSHVIKEDEELPKRLYNIITWIINHLCNNEKLTTPSQWAKLVCS